MKITQRTLAHHDLLEGPRFTKIIVLKLMEALGADFKSPRFNQLPKDQLLFFSSDLLPRFPLNPITAGFMEVLFYSLRTINKTLMNKIFESESHEVSITNHIIAIFTWQHL